MTIFYTKQRIKPNFLFGITSLKYSLTFFKKVVTKNSNIFKFFNIGFALFIRIILCIEQCEVA